MPVLAVIVAPQITSAQLTDWADLLGGAGNEIGYAVATDVDGSVVVAGSFEGTTAIDGVQITSAGYADVFVAKFSPTGALTWLKRLGGASTDAPAGVAVDSATGDVVVTGHFSVTATVDGRSLQGVGASDVFVVSFSKQGTLRWVTSFGSAADDLAAAVAVNLDGDSIVAGQFSGSFRCGSSTLVSVGGTDMFVANVAIDGGVRWCRRFGGTSDDVVGGVAVSESGLFALAGGFGNATDIGGGPITGAGLFDAFVGAYTVSNGDYRWGRRLGGTGYDGARGVAFDASDAVVVAGYFGLFGGGVDFGGGVVTPQGGADAFVAKFGGSDGRYLWANRFGGTYDDYGNGVGVAPDGGIVIAGEFQGTASFAGVTATSRGQFDAYWASFSATGAPRAWRSYGDLVNDKAFGIALDPDGDWFITGFSIYRIDLGAGPLYCAGQADAFLSKIAPDGAAPATPTPTFTATRLPATPTWTSAPTWTPTQSVPTFTATVPFTATRTFTPAATRTFTPTFTATRVSSPTSTRPPATFTASFTPTRTATRTPTKPTPTNTVAATATRTATGTLGGSTPTLAVPARIANLSLWLDASQIVGVAEGASVGRWADASGAAHHATQTSALRQPIYRGTALSGKPAVRFDGTDDYLNLTGTVVSGAQPRTIFFVARPDVSGNRGIVDLGFGGTLGGAFMITPEYGIRTNGGRRLWSPSAPTSSVNIGVVQLIGNDTSTISLVINGSLRTPASTVSGVVNTAGIGVIGTWAAEPVGAFNFDGDIAEIIVYNRTLTTTERQSVELYLSTKY